MLFESSIKMSILVIWKYQNDHLILMVDIGHHDILKKL
jgi:mRNA interferase RelE/StbE